MNAERERLSERAGREAGFTLVEALTAMVVLIFGLMAVTNLMIVAASSNSVANQGTAATTSASQALDYLKTVPFLNLPGSGGSFVSPVRNDTSSVNCATLTPATIVTNFSCFDDVPGVGRVVTQWTVINPEPRVRFIRVRSEGTAPLAGARSRSEFTLIRTCTDRSSTTPPGGCP
jgi:hypothetical protein